MKNSNKAYYFIGIGGIGMSALAAFFHKQGHSVYGYDKTPGDITDMLIRQGIGVTFNEEITAIPALFTNKEFTEVVYTPAIPMEHPQLQFFLSKHFNVKKRSEVLAHIASTMKNIAIAGTHGKTSITTLTAWLLNQHGAKTNAFLGGISNNFGSNLVLHPEANIVVLEADEYDRSFLRLHPDLALVSYIDADHLDIYGSAENMREAYNDFIRQVKPSGAAVVKHDIADRLAAIAQVRHYTYSAFSTGADFHAVNNRISEGQTHFDLIIPGGIIENLRIRYAGRHHIENAVAATALAWLSGAPEANIRDGLADFTGVKRRFEYIVKTPGFAYIDDYAHHPREIAATLEAARSLFPGRKITGVFQPHLYTRTRDFADEFAEILSQFDEIILTDIYPARELPIPGISSQMILDKMSLNKKTLCSYETLVDYIGQNLGTDVLITMGAGDIDRLVNPISKLFRQ